MRIQVLDEPVRQNVEVFLQILCKAQQKGKQQPSSAEKVYEAWLHKETGQLRFAGVGKEPKSFEERDWKPIRLTFQYHSTEGEIEFSVDEVGESQVFHSKDLTPIALQTLQRTMKVFNELSRTLKGPSNLDTKIAVLSKLIILPEISNHARNMIIDLWHNVDRIQAERLLVDKPVGTYLFRKDPYAKILEERLKEELLKEIYCFTLTYSQEDHKISDCTLVHVDGTWQIYNDDPSLERQTFSDLKDLVASLGGALKYPLYRV